MVARWDTVTPGGSPVSARRRRLTAVCVPLLLVGWVVLSYGWSCWFGFINDDYVWVERAWASATGAATPSGGTAIFLRPAAELSFLIDYALYGTRPFGYHLTNVLIESLNTCLVWRVAAVLFADTMAGALVALLFAGHSSHAGSVTWVCGRTELIAASFYLLAVWAHLRRRRGWAAVCLGAALLAKEVAVSFPALALSVDYIQKREPRWRRGSLLVYGGVLVAYFLLRTITATGYTGYVGLDALVHPNGLRLLRVVGQQAVGAAGALMEPLRLEGMAAATVLVGLVAASLWCAVRPADSQAVRVGACWIVVAALPFLGWQMFPPRYGYLLSVGLACALVGGGRGLIDRLSNVRAAARPWARWVSIVCVLLWLGASEFRLQSRNEQLRRNALTSARIVRGVGDAVPHPAPHTVFVIEGIGALRTGADPWVRTPVFVFGLGDAVRLHYHDATLDAVCALADAAPGRPLVRLRWDPRTGTFES